MTGITYWHMQMHPDEPAFAEEHVYYILEQKNIIGLATWDEGKTYIKDFNETMNVNDIVAIKTGSRLVALVQVIGGPYQVTGDTSDIGWIENRRPIRILDWAIDKKTIPHSRNTLTVCSDSDAKTTQIIKEWHLSIEESYKKRGLPLWV